MDTANELKKGDDYQTEWESNYDSARDECLTEADNILMEVEHMVDDINQTVKVQDNLILADAINKVVNLRYFRFSSTVYGKYNTWVEDFDYDFTKQITDVLQDRLSFEFKIGAK